jgi:hypothetical protein
MIVDDRCIIGLPEEGGRLRRHVGVKTAGAALNYGIYVGCLAERLRRFDRPFGTLVAGAAVAMSGDDLGTRLFVFAR